MKGTVIIFLTVFFIHPLFGQAPRLVLPIGHTDYINQVRFSPNGKTLLTCSHDKTAKLWDAATGYLLADLAGHQGQVSETRISADGKRILTISDFDEQMKLWNAATGVMLLDSIGQDGLRFAEFFEEGKRFIYIAFDTAYICDAENGQGKSSFFTGSCRAATLSPDNNLLATFNADDSVRVWSIKEGLLKYKFFAGKKHWRLSIGNDGITLLLEEKLGSRMVWDLEKGKPSAGILSKIASRISKDIEIDHSGDPQRMTLVSADSVSLIDLQTGKKIFFVKPERSARFFKAKLFHNGNLLMTAENYDIRACKVKIWDISTSKDGRPLHEFIYRDIGSIDHLEISSDDRRIYLGSNTADESYLIDPVNGSIITRFNDHGESYYMAAFNSSGNKLVTVSTGKPRIWDYFSGKPDSSINQNICFTAEFSPDDRRIFLGGYSTVWLKDLNTGKNYEQKTEDSRLIRQACFSQDGTKILFFDSENTAVVWSTIDHSVISRSRAFGQGIRMGNFSADGSRVIGAINDSIIIWDASTWKIVNVFRQPKRTDIIHNVAFSPDGKKFLAAYYRGKIKVFDLATGTALDSLTEGESFIRSAVFSKDDNKIGFISYEYKIGVYDLVKRQKRILPNDNNKQVNSVCFSPDGNYIVSTSEDHTCKLWHTGTGELISTFFSVDSTDYFTTIPTGYYQTTQGAARLLHYVTPDLKVLTFDQLDVKYNRPDKVLEAIGNTDTALISSYRKAWEKRIQKLGIDTSQFRDGYSVPEADFMDRDTISYEQKSRELVLRIKGSDSSYLLDRMNIWVNESPVYGQKGISLRQRQSNRIDTTISIRLSQGENRIETSITSLSGTESYRVPLVVNYSPALKRKEITHFIGIGIDHFARDFYNLQYSTKDIRDLALALKEKFGNDLVIDTLFNEKVNRDNIRELKKKLALATEDDRVILSYSGHGLLSKDYEYFLSTYNIDFRNPALDGLPYQDLEDLLDGIPPRRKLMLIDACNSGEVDKETGITMRRTADSLGLSKGGVTQYSDSTRVGLKNSFELMQSIFINVGRGTGATIISAAAGNQFALERDDLRNGVFTFCLLEALKKYPEMMISQLKRLVAERVLQLTQGLQQPTYRKEMLTVDWKLW